MIDTHCHLDWDSYKEDLELVLSKAHEAGVEKIITIGVDEESNVRTRDLLKSKLVYRCVGYHPDVVLKPDFDSDKINGLIEKLNEELGMIKTVGVGECGLDYYIFERENLDETKKTELKELQKELFERQVLCAVQNGLPLSLHARDDSEQAYEDLAEVLSEYYSPELDFTERSFKFLLPDLKSNDVGAASVSVDKKVIPGVLHCVSGPIWYIKHCLELGFMVSFAGNITFKNAEQIVKIAEAVPLDKIVIETDGPFLAPIPYRGKRNEPAFVGEVAKKLSDIKGVSIDEISKVTTENAKLLFAFE